MDLYTEDEVQPAYADAPTFAFSNAAVAGGIDEEGHLNAGDLWGVQKKTFYIRTPEGATLEQLAAGNGRNGVAWELPNEMKRLLRQVNKTTNRSHVTDKDLDGSINKALFLAAKVLWMQNSSPKPIGLRIPGLVGNMMTETTNFNWVIPGDCPVTVINQSIMDPNNIFTRRMYEHNSKCDLKTLERHIMRNIDPSKMFMGMDTKGIGWKVLLDNMRIPGTEYAAAADAIIAKNQHYFKNPDSVEGQIVKVPYEIGESIYDAIAEPLREIEKSYIDFAKWRPTFHPVDGHAWNSQTGLAKDAAVFGADHVGFEVETKLNTPFTAGIALEIEYVLGDSTE